MNLSEALGLSLWDTLQLSKCSLSSSKWRSAGMLLSSFKASAVRELVVPIRCFQQENQPHLQIHQPRSHPHLEQTLQLLPFKTTLLWPGLWC